VTKSEDRREIFTKLYNENYPKVLRLCAGYVSGNVVLAKDLTQEVFVKIWLNLDKFKSQSKISTWIYRIAVNTCLLHKRKSRRITEVVFPLIYNEDKVELESKMNKMYACIEKLTPKNKTIILLELESIPQKEIAQVMGMTHEAVRVRILRTKQKLSNLVRE